MSRPEYLPGHWYLVETTCINHTDPTELCLLFCRNPINTTDNPAQKVDVHFNLKLTEDIDDLQDYLQNYKKGSYHKNWGTTVGRDTVDLSYFKESWNIEKLGKDKDKFFPKNVSGRQWTDQNALNFLNFVLREMDKFAEAHARTELEIVQESLFYSNEAKRKVKNINYNDVQIADVIAIVSNNTTAIASLGESQFQNPLDYDRSEERLVDFILLANHVGLKNCRLVPKNDNWTNCSKKPLIHLWYIFNASLIAGIGLATNSGPVVVASMLVSSMMEPIKGMSLSIRYLCGYKRKCNSKQFRRFGCHFMTLVIDLLICILVGMFVGWIVAMPSGASSPYSIMEELSGLHYGKNESNNNLRMPDEISGRAKPIGLLISMVIAIASALALITADKQGNKSALVGIGISASLLPPAVNAGILWSFEAANKNCVEFDIFERVVVDSTLTFGDQGGISLALTFVNVGVILFVWTIGYQLRNWCMKSHMMNKIIVQKEIEKDALTFTQDNPGILRALKILKVPSLKDEEQPLIQF